MRVCWVVPSASWGKRTRAVAVLSRLPGEHVAVTVTGDDWPMRWAGIETVRAANCEAIRAEARAADVVVCDTDVAGPNDGLLETLWECRSVWVWTPHRHDRGLPDGLHNVVVAADPDCPYQSVDCSPIILGEPAPRAVARRHWRAGRRPLVLAVETLWARGLVERMARRAVEGLDVDLRVADPHRDFPVGRWLAGADVVVSAAGGRIVDECRRAGVAHVAFPHPLARDQAARATCAWGDVTAAVRAAAAADRPPAVVVPNGAERAAATILGL